MGFFELGFWTFAVCYSYSKVFYLKEGIAAQKARVYSQGFNFDRIDSSGCLLVIQKSESYYPPEKL